MGGFATACLTASEAVEKELLSEEQARELLLSVADKVAPRMKAEKTSADYRQKLEQAMSECLQVSRRAGEP